MQLKDKVILVTGANRGIGQAIVKEFLKHDIAKIYVAARKVESLPDFADKRVKPIALDISNPAQVAKAAAEAKDVNVLVNNAGVAAASSILTGPFDILKSEMDVNYYGTLSMMQAFAPVLGRSAEGAIVNILSVVSLANLPMLAGYSATKAALLSATQAVRSELEKTGIKVMGVFPGAIDTDLTRDMAMPKDSPQAVAKELVEGLLAGAEDVFPGQNAKAAAQLWSHDPKALEKLLAGRGESDKAA